MLRKRADLMSPASQAASAASAGPRSFFLGDAQRRVDATLAWCGDVMAAPLRSLGAPVAGAFGGLVCLGGALGVVAGLGRHADDTHTPAQFGLAALCVCVVAFWGAFEAAFHAARGKLELRVLPGLTNDNKTHSSLTGAAADVESQQEQQHHRRELSHTSSSEATTPRSAAATQSTPAAPAMTKETPVLHTEPAEKTSALRLAALRAGAEFALTLAAIYACDRTDLARRGPKVRDARAFWTLWHAVCLVAAFTLRRVKPTGGHASSSSAALSSINAGAAALSNHHQYRPLSREQTDEWKGWMQLMFLFYHYFAEAELYNAIRIYIAAYVFLTGYGNFLYYQKTGNFGAARLAQSLFRLNFFVVFVCVALRNEFMLYYICPMHTFFTLFVWLALRLRADLNENLVVISVKLCVALASTCALYDVPSIFKFGFGWQPLRALLAFHDPLHPEFTDELHEWHFRSGLDRFVWIFGMLCAALYARFERCLETIDDVASFQRRTLARCVVVACVVAMSTPWALRVFVRPKFEYNALHPYTSWLPILAYVVLRNLLPVFRAYYVGLFAFLGKITLETYILQFHVWMRTTGLNGSPKFLLCVLPEPYFWTNLALVSAFYVLLSHRIFRLTGTLKDCLVPTEPARLYRGAALALAVAAAFYLFGLACRAFVDAQQLPRPPHISGGPDNFGGEVLLQVDPQAAAAAAAPVAAVPAAR